MFENLEPWKKYIWNKYVGFRDEHEYESDEFFNGMCTAMMRFSIKNVEPTVERVMEVAEEFEEDYREAFTEWAKDEARGGYDFCISFAEWLVKKNGLLREIEAAYDELGNESWADKLLIFIRFGTEAI